MIVRPPSDLTVLVGSDASFECSASGDPSPQVVWRRQEGFLPAGRARSTESRTGLRIERVTAADSGRYICEVENSVGTASASALLTVIVPPTWNPISASNGGLLAREIRTQPEQSVFLDCPVFGTPRPLVFWNREASSPPEMLAASANQSVTSGRWRVFPNGTLHISGARREDSGSLWCGAVNEAGSLVARTRLEVVSAPIPAPVVVEIGPWNQTLPLKSAASLACQAEGQPVKWFKDGIEMNLTPSPESIHRQRIWLTDAGTLKIDDLQASDAATYTCWCGRGDHISKWSATLTVANPANPNVVFIRSPSDPMALPGSPSQPRLLHRTATTLTIGWQSGSRMGASALLGYTVEVFTSGDEEEAEGGGGWTWSGQKSKRSWRIVARRLKSDQMIMLHLKPGSAHQFVVRAENSHGLSLPSPTSPWFSTLSSSSQLSSQWQSVAELEEAKLRLSAPWIRLDHVINLIFIIIILIF